MPRFDPYRRDADERGAGLEPLTAVVAGVWDDGPESVLPRALELCRDWGDRLPVPGGGDTLGLWQGLAAVAAVDLTTARVLEPHLDARAILAQAGQSTSGSATWGVFAAEGPGSRVEATPAGEAWELTGRKPWCSLAGRLDRALVTAWTSPTRRRLFDVDLRHPSVTAAEQDGWQAHGLALVVSQPVDLDATPAVAVGEDDWYLTRPGFAWGGMGVAACWWGGAAGLARRLRQQARQREPDQVALVHLGAVDTALHQSGVVLAAAAAAVDAGTADGPAGAALALRVRGAVRRAAEEVLERCGHALGPAPLAREAEHARRVADLQLYLRQDHAERDEAALGRALLEDDVPAGWVS